MMMINKILCFFGRHDPEKETIICLVGGKSYIEVCKHCGARK